MSLFLCCSCVALVLACPALLSSCSRLVLADLVLLLAQFSLLLCRLLVDVGNLLVRRNWAGWLCFFCLPSICWILRTPTYTEPLHHTPFIFVDNDQLLSAPWTRSASPHFPASRFQQLQHNNRSAVTVRDAVRLVSLSLAGYTSTCSYSEHRARACGSQVLSYRTSSYFQIERLRTRTTITMTIKTLSAFPFVSVASPRISSTPRHNP